MSKQMDAEQWLHIDPVKSEFFDRNIDLFRNYDAQQADLVASSLDQAKQIEFLSMGPEQYACRIPGEEQPFYDPSSLLSQLQAEYNRILNVFERKIEFMLIAGSGLGFLAAHVEEDIRGRMDRGLLLMENRPEFIAAQFCLFDCQSLLRSEQIFWAVGRDLLEVVKQIFQRFRFDLIPPHRIYPTQERRLTSSERAAMQGIAKWISSNGKQTHIQRQKDDNRFRAAGKKPLQLNPGRIWGHAAPEAYAHFPLIRSLLQGFEMEQWQTCLSETQNRFAGHYAIHESMIRFIPDVLLVCNSANESFLNQQFHPLRIVWLLDHPRYFAGDSLNRFLSHKDFVFYIDRSYESLLEDVQAKSCRFLPASASFHKTGQKREQFAAPILFVGSYQDASPFFESLPLLMRNKIYELLQFLIEHPIQTGSQAANSLSLPEEAVEILQKKADEYTKNIHNRLQDAPRRLDYFLYSMANSFKRKQIVSELLDLGIVVYGPDSWKPVLGEKYARQYRGWMHNDDLADAYASASLVLNIHSLQCPTCLNPRDFDVLAAGGCLLTDWVEDCDRGLLAPGVDCIAAKTGEIKSQAEYWLARPQEREEIQRQGHETYRQRHTPQHRAREMIQVLRENYTV